MAKSASIALSFRATINRGGIDPHTVNVSGRVAWAILSLVGAGSRGCTPIDRPAPRWSDYVFKAKKLGFVIETKLEGHEGSFAGQHGRYVLHDSVTVSGGTLEEYLSSPEGRREFAEASFSKAA